MTWQPAAPGEPSRHADPTSAAGGPAPHLVAGWRCVIRGTGVVLLATVAGTALLGAVATHWAGMLIVAPGLGAVLAAVVALVDPSARRGMFWAGVTGVVLVPFANGLVLLGAAGGSVALVILCLGPVVAVGWSAFPEDPRVREDLTALREMLPLLPTADLLEEWRASEDLLRSPPDRAAAAGIRALLLDELAHRDPRGVAGWLSAGGSSPDAYIRADRGSTA